MNTGVYILYHIYNPDIKYIGSTKRIGFKQRFNNHLGELRRSNHNNTHLQSVCNKYGIEGFRFEILQEYLPEYCIEAEQFWIDCLNSYKEGYNQSRKAGCISLPFEERRIATKDMQKTILQIDKNNKIIGRFVGIHEGSRQTRINAFDISTCCNKRTKTRMAGGYLWCFEEDYSEDIKYTSKYNNKGVLQYNKEGILIREWSSVQEAANFYSKGRNGNITNCCKGLVKSVYNSTWKYKEY